MERIDGIAGAEPGFDGGRDQGARAAQTADGGEALGERGHAVAGFERIAGRDHEPHLIEPEGAGGLAGDLDMALMGGIEGAAEKSDPEATVVATG
ncbi:hypothetical protein AA21952_1725 [Acetobacter oeni LMG 21952]|nr:hypothetical protein AA21952_1725 [Acetobacter oeni LMG 21952]